MDTKEKNFKQYFVIFNLFTREIESLKEFYYRSHKSMIEYRIKVESDYKYGKIINDYLDEILSSEENMDSKIKEIEEKIIDGVKVSDILMIKPIKEKKIISIWFKNKFINKDYYSPNIARRKYDSINNYENILVSSVLSNIIIIFESFLAKLYKLLIKENPLWYFKDQTMLVADLFDKNASYKIKRKIDSEVENKMYNSLELLKIITKTEKVNLNRYENILVDFVEIYHRRNSYVHNDGKVNTKYLENVNQQFTKKIKENDKFVCDQIYIENTFIVLTKLVFVFIFEILTKRKVNEESIFMLSTYFFNALKNKEYNITKLAYYAFSQYKEFNFQDRTMFRINYMNSIKQLNKNKELEKEIKELDVSIATDEYKIAKECLKDNNKKVYEMLKDTYPKSFDAVAIREWPIFINFRETKYYSKFVALYPKDFEMLKIEKDENVSNDI